MCVLSSGSGALDTCSGNTYPQWAESVSNQISAAPSLVPGTLRIVKDFWASPGTPAKPAALLVSCGGATELRVLSVKREGGKTADALEFAYGVRLTEGERFGNS